MPDEQKPPRRTRLYALILMAVVAWGTVVATDDGSLKTLAMCTFTGDLAFEKVDGRAFEVDYYGMKYAGTLDNWVDSSVYFWGAHEKFVLHAMRDILAVTNPDGDGVAVDIGANVGTHTMYLAKHAKTVHAIEPWPTVLKRLVHHVDTNALTNVVVHPVGVAAEAGTLPFHVPPGWNLGWGSFSDSFAAEYDKGEGEVIDLPLVVGDTYLAQKGVSHVDLIKIDIEGYERPALQGFAQIMNRDQTSVLFEMNVRNEEGFHSEQELRATFPSGYEFYSIEPGPKLSWRIGERELVCKVDEGIYHIAAFDMDFSRDTRTLLALPPGVRERMKTL